MPVIAHGCILFGARPSLRGKPREPASWPPVGSNALTCRATICSPQFWEFVEAGDTFSIVEHDMRIVARADWIIDLGPSAGSRGGRIMAGGRSSELAADAGNPTAKFPRSLSSCRLQEVIRIGG